MLRRSRGKSPEDSPSDDSAQENEEESQQIVPKKRGRKPEEPKWSRVLKFSQLMDDEPTLYPIVKDLNRLAEDLEEGAKVPKNFKGLIVISENLEKKDWAPRRRSSTSE